MRLSDGGEGWWPRGLAAVTGLVVVTTATLASALSISPGRLLPPVVWSVIPAFLGVRLLPARAAATAILLAVPGELLAAGLPLRSLEPDAWPGYVASLIRLLGHAVPPRNHQAGAQSIAAAALLAGTMWTVGAALGASASRRRVRTCWSRLQSAVGFVLLATPWLVLVSLTLSEDQAWQGAVVLIAAVLWFCAERRALILALIAAVPGAALAGAVGPPNRWFPAGGSGRLDPTFTTLDVVPTYAPLDARSTGARMLTVTAPEPALWGMQTLEYVRGTWTIVSHGLPDLPEPAATLEDVRVRVDGLRDSLVAAPGRVVQVRAPGAATRTPGGGVRLAPAPTPGSSYRVEAEVVRATAEQLSRDRVPLQSGARAYTRVSGSPTRGTIGSRLPPLLAALEALFGAPSREAVDARVVALARRLAAGRPTEWEMVGRVEHFLVDSGRFRYTTDVPQPGWQPLADFLLRTRAGYCQQFAGAAALLLRLAGVPARVVVGFATGRQIEPNRYAVRDLDAHEWIEVYFERYGWVPFNPTPSASPALIASGVDPLLQAPAATGAGGGGYLYAAAVAALTVGLCSRLRRRRNQLPRDWLRRVARQAGACVGPSTTLTELRSLLATRIGPRTAAITADIERVRFGPGPAITVEHPRLHLARALLGDLGLVGCLRFWIRPIGR